MQRYSTAMTNGGMCADPDGLSDDILRANVPAIFAREPHQSRSDQYSAVPTSEILRGFRQEGFQPVMAQQAKPRDNDRLGTAKHLLRLRHRSLADDNGDAFEVIFLNAFDGTSSTQLFPGYFRFVCANGLFTGTALQSVQVRHTGNAAQEVIEGAYTILEEAPRVSETIGLWKGIEVSHENQLKLARRAAELRFDGKVPARLNDSAMSSPHRQADTASDLWTVFNRTQENMQRGGFSYDTVSYDGNREKIRKNTARPVRGIDSTRDMNRRLWDAAAEIAETVPA